MKQMKWNSIGFSIILFVMAFAVTQLGYGQAQGNIWYFGDKAGIDFNQGKPKALLDGALVTDEGCATISDPRGNLLFYTDGITVWNRDHQPMPNGTNLLGDPSSTQSGVIVPEPESTTRYYVFTVAKETGTDGLRYSVVDMDRDGGLGDVIQKNQTLYSRSTEKITAVFHKNEIDFWVITHGWSNNAFFAHKVTRSGVSKNPVVSYIGSRHQGLVDNSIGQMTASSDGKKIALATYSMRVVELFDFDNETGKISNPIKLPSTSYDYGVSFSPDNTKLYISTWNQQGENTITQYDLNAGSPDAIAQSGVVIVKSNVAYGSLQLATDQKIYVTRYDKTFLGTINKPNEKGKACEFQEQGFNLEGRLSKGGLPTIIQSFFVPPSINFAGICVGQPTEFNLSKKTNIDELAWNFGDPESGAANTSSELEPSHTFSKPGKYKVSLTIRFLRFEETITKEIEILDNPKVDLAEEITVCKGETANIEVQPPVGTKLNWSNGNTTNKVSINTPTQLSLNLDQNGCKSVYTTRIRFQEPPTVSLPQAVTFCEDSSSVLELDIPDATYKWSNTVTANKITVKEEGTYGVTVTQGKCVVTAATKVSTDKLPVLTLDETVTICDGKQTNLTATSTSTAKVSWSNGKVSNGIPVGDAGTYTATVTNGACKVSGSTTVEVVKPIADLGTDTAICSGQVLELSVNQNGAEYAWSNGATDAGISVIDPGTFGVTVTIGECTASDQIKVEVLKPVVDLGTSDTALCGNENLIFDVTMPGVSGVVYAWSDGVNTPKREINASGNYKVTVSVGKCSVEDEVKVKFDPVIEAALPEKTVICLGETAELGGFKVPGASYIWNNGETTPTINITEGGDYQVTVTAGACQEIYSSELIVESIEKNIQPTANICKGDAYTVDATLPGAAYAWNDGTTEGKRALTEAGTYIVTITSGACTLEKSIELTVDSIDTEIGQDTILCEGEQISLKVNIVSGSVVWSNGATANPTVVTASGLYAATVTQGACSLPTESINIEFQKPPVIELGEDQQLCEGEVVPLNVNVEDGVVAWSTGASTQSIEATTTNNYSVTVTRGNCEVTDQVSLTFDEKPIIELDPLYRICEGESVELNVKQNNATYTWSNGQTSSYISATEAGEYSVTVNRGVCSETGMTEVQVDAPKAKLGSDTTLCFDEVLLLNAAQENAEFAWSDGSNTPQIQVREPGNYQLTVTVGECTAEDEILVEFGRPEITNLPSDTTICNDQTITVGGITGAKNIVWSDQRNSPNVEFTQSGTYSVTASTDRCEVTAEMNLTVVPKVFDLGNDTTICAGEVLLLSAEEENATYVWSDSSSQSSIEVNSPQTVSLTRTIGGCVFTDQLVVDVRNPRVEFPSDTTLCEGEQLVLKAEQPVQSKYIWSSGETTSSIAPTQAGTYSVTVSQDRCSDESSITVIIHNPIADLGEDKEICAGDSIAFEFNDPQATYAWSNGSNDGTQYFSKSGNYALTTTIGRCTATDEIALTVQDPKADLGDNIVACAGSPLSLDVTQEGAQYAWSTGATTPKIDITEAGEYSVTVALGSCSAVDQVEVRIDDPKADLGKDTVLCYGEQYILNVENDGDGSGYLWSDGSTGTTLNVTQAGEYSVTVSAGDCKAEDQVNIEYRNPLAYLGRDTTLCENDVLEYDVTQPDATYAWSDGVTSAKRELNTAGNYILTVSIGRCEATDDINIQYNKPSADFGVTDTVICEQEEVLLSLPQDNAEYAWSTGESTPEITVKSAGLITLTVTIGNCKDEGKINVIQNTIDLNLPEDITICSNDSFKVDLSSNLDASIQWSDNINEAVRYFSTEGVYNVSVSKGKCNETASTTLTVNSPDANIGRDTVLCPGEQLEIDKTQANASFIWSDGSTDAIRTITKNGTYNLTVSIGECKDIGKLAIFYNDPKFNLPEDTVLCNQETLVLTVDKPKANFNWSSGEATNSITISEPGNYALTLALGRCEFSDEIEISYNRPNLDLGPDTTICAGSSYTILLDEPETRYQWADGTSGGGYTISEAGLKTVTAFQGRCEKSDSILIAVSDPKVDLGSDTVICKGETVVLDAGIDEVSYAWNDQTGNKTLTVESEGVYWVNILDKFNCSATDSIQVDYDSAVVDLGMDTSICPKIDSFEILVADTSLLFKWSDGSTAQSKIAFADNTYGLTVTNPNGCQGVDELVVGMRDDCLRPLYIPRVFSPNFDDKNDGWQCLGDAFDFHVRIWDRAGVLVYESFDHKTKWNGRLPSDEKAPVGNYIMIIEYVDIYDNPHRLSEALTLWR